jgi:hypothetical protein
MSEDDDKGKAVPEDLFAALERKVDEAAAKKAAQESLFTKAKRNTGRAVSYVLRLLQPIFAISWLVGMLRYTVETLASCRPALSYVHDLSPGLFDHLGSAIGRFYQWSTAWYPEIWYPIVQRPLALVGIDLPDWAAALVLVCSLTVPAANRGMSFFLHYSELPRRSFIGEVFRPGSGSRWLPVRAARWVGIQVLVLEQRVMGVLSRPFAQRLAMLFERAYGLFLIRTLEEQKFPADHKLLKALKANRKADSPAIISLRFNMDAFPPSPLQYYLRTTQRIVVSALIIVGSLVSVAAYLLIIHAVSLGCHAVFGAEEAANVLQSHSP